jgi:hypothetical protein
VDRRAKVELFEQIRREHAYGAETIQGMAKKLGVHRRRAGWARPCKWRQTLIQIRPMRAVNGPASPCGDSVSRQERARSAVAELFEYGQPGSYFVPTRVAPAHLI